MFRRNILRFGFALCAVALAVAIPPRSAPAASAPIVWQDFVAIGVSADGQHLFGRLPGTLGGEPLGTVPLTGGDFVELISPPISRYEVNPTRDWVVFQGTPVGNPNPSYLDQFRFWSVPILGGAPVPISEPTESLSYSGALWKFSPDGLRLTYLEPKTLGDNPDVLKTRRLDGLDSPVILSPDTGRVMRWAISPDNQWVVMWVGDSGSANINTRREKWSIVNSRLLRVPLVGPKTNTITLDGTPGSTGVYSAFAFSADGSRLVYTLNGIVWSVDLASGTRIRLSPPGYTFNDDYSHIQVTSGSGRAIWDVGVYGPVFSTPVAGPEGASVNLSASLPGAIYNSGLDWSWRAPANGEYVIMRTGNSVYSVPASGTGAAVLLADGGSNGVGFKLTADRLVYSVSNGQNYSNVYSIPYSGPTGSQALAVAGWNGSDYLVSPNGAVIAGPLTKFPRTDLFSVPVFGPSQAMRNESYVFSAPSFDPEYSWMFSPDSRYMIIPGGGFSLTYVFELGSGPGTLRLSSDCNSDGSGVAITPEPSQSYQLFLTSVGRCILTSSSP